MPRPLVDIDPHLRDDIQLYGRSRSRPQHHNDDSKNSENTALRYLDGQNRSSRHGEYTIFGRDGASTSFVYNNSRDRNHKDDTSKPKMPQSECEFRDNHQYYKRDREGDDYHEGIRGKYSDRDRYYDDHVDQFRYGKHYQR